MHYGTPRRPRSNFQVSEVLPSGHERLDQFVQGRWDALEISTGGTGGSKSARVLIPGAAQRDLVERFNPLGLELQPYSIPDLPKVTIDYQDDDSPSVWFRCYFYIIRGVSHWVVLQADFEEVPCVLIPLEKTLLYVIHENMGAFRALVKIAAMRCGAPESPFRWDYRAILPAGGDSFVTFSLCPGTRLRDFFRVACPYLDLDTLVMRTFWRVDPTEEGAMEQGQEPLWWINNKAARAPAQEQEVEMEEEEEEEEEGPGERRFDQDGSIVLGKGYFYRTIPEELTVDELDWFDASTRVAWIRIFHDPVGAGVAIEGEVSEPLLLLDEGNAVDMDDDDDGLPINRTKTRLSGEMNQISVSGPSPSSSSSSTSTYIITIHSLDTNDDDEEEDEDEMQIGRRRISPPQTPRPHFRSLPPL